MKIPLVQSRLGLPGSTGQRQIRRNPYQSVGENIAQAGDVITRIAKERQQKLIKTQVYEAENELRSMSRDRYINANEERRGKLALPDEESGTKGVYRDYSEEADKFISEKIKTLPPEFHGYAKRQLQGVSEGYKDRFAAYQSQQEAVHRKQVLERNIDEIQQTVNADMATGLGADALFEGLDEVETRIREEARGGDVEGYVEKVRRDMIKQGLLSMATNEPIKAQTLLLDDKMKEELEPSQIEALGKVLEEKVLTHKTEQTIAQLGATGLDYPEQIALAEDLTDDPDVYKEVVGELNWRDNQQKRVKKRKQYDLVVETYDRIFADQEQIDPMSLHTDPAFEILEPNQKELIKSWLGGGEKGKMNDLARLQSWGNARGKIIAGEMTPTDVIQAGLSGEIDIRDAKSLVKFAEDVRAQPKMRAADDVMRSKYEKIWKDTDDRYDAQKKIMDAIYEFQTVNEQFPTYKDIEDIVDWAVTETGGKKFLGMTFGAEAPYETEDSSLIEDIVGGYKASGYPQAVFDPQTRNIILGKNDKGQMMVVHPGDKKITLYE